MDKKQTRFSFLYESLREQILSGQRKNGSKLPSTYQLSKLYQVGIGTAKAVLHALRDEGFIQTAKRQRAVVIYQISPTEQKRAAIRSIVGRRFEILDMYRTAEVLMPDILAFCAQFSNLIELKHYEPMMRWVFSRRSTGRWKSPSAFLHELMDASGNPLFSDLYAALEFSGEVFLILEYLSETATDSPHAEKQALNLAIEALQCGNYYTIRDRFQAYYHTVTLLIERSLKDLSAYSSEIATEKNYSFSWSMNLSWNHYYQQIAQDLIEKIRIGIYPPGTFLPSETALAKKHQVSVHTVRRALEQLESLGLTKTFNGRGSQVLALDKRLSLKRINKSGMSLYINAVQLMALAIRPAALMAFDALRADPQKLQQRKSLPPGDPPANILSFLIDHIPLLPLQRILRETSRSLYLGLYFYRYEKSRKRYLGNLEQRAFACLQRGARQEFASLLFESYCYILSSARKILIEEGFPEAEKIVVPV